MRAMSGAEPFAVHADPADLVDLRSRLRATRWPDTPEDAGWSLGTDLGYLQELVAYWAEHFDWPSQEAALARLPRFRTHVRGVGIAFLHARAAVPALPLILCHGWPDSSWRYEKVLPLLTEPGAHGADPADAFDMIVPDMPGFGHSDRRVFDSITIAGMWAELMTALDYPRFGVAGGDIGSSVSRYLALDHPSRVVAVHRMESSMPVATGTDLTAAERTHLDTAAAWKADEGAYAEMHLTRYWLTATIGSSMRMYAANAAIPAEQHARRVEVPSGFTVFPGDTLHPPRAWLERTANVVRYTEAERGGHFAPFEEPELYARELREFFRPYRTVTGRP